MKHAIGGRVLAAPFPIPELARVADGAPADWTLAPVDALPDVPDYATLLELRGADEQVWASFRADADAERHRIRFADDVEFAVDRAARTVGYRARPQLEPRTLRHLLLDQVLPRLLAADGELVIHASAVAADGGAIAFLGPSGAGKSTLAGAFVARGATLLADDFLVLRERDAGYEVLAAYGGLRLWEDSAAVLAGDVAGLDTVADYTVKRRWAPGGGAPAAAPLQALVVLDPSPPEPDHACSVGLVRGSDAFAVLFHQGFRLAPHERTARAAELERFARLARSVPLLALTHKRAYEQLGDVVTAVADAVGRVSPAARPPSG